MSASALLVRPYCPRDAGAVAAIYASYVATTTATFETEPPGESEMAQRLAVLVDGGYPVLVAEVEGRLAGYAYAASFRPRPAYRQTVEHSVYVSPGCQRGGVGMALMHGLIAACHERGFTQMVGVIADSDTSASIPFHEKLGFRLAGRLEGVGLKFSRALGVTLMQRSTRP
jgi:L-amino acid N-acyltransferase YncA